jgi:hypothetical protein
MREATQLTLMSSDYQQTGGVSACDTGNDPHLEAPEACVAEEDGSAGGPRLRRGSAERVREGVEPSHGQRWLRYACCWVFWSESVNNGQTLWTFPQATQVPERSLPRWACHTHWCVSVPWLCGSACTPTRPANWCRAGRSTRPRRT